MQENLHLDEQVRMDAVQEKVWQAVSVHRGAGNAIRVASLRIITGLNERGIRQAVKELIEDHGKPIGSTTAAPAGYYVIDSDEERKKVQRGLYGRAMSILRRARAYEANPIRRKWVSGIVGQLQLFENKSSSKGGERCL